MATEIIKSFEIYVYKKRINCITDNMIDTFYDHMKDIPFNGYKELSAAANNSIVNCITKDNVHCRYLVKAGTFEDALITMRNFLEKAEK